MQIIKLPTVRRPALALGVPVSGEILNSSGVAMPPALRRKKGVFPVGYMIFICRQLLNNFVAEKRLPDSCQK